MWTYTWARTKTDIEVTKSLVAKDAFILAAILVPLSCLPLVIVLYAIGPSWRDGVILIAATTPYVLFVPVIVWLIVKGRAQIRAPEAQTFAFDVGRGLLIIAMKRTVERVETTVKVETRLFADLVSVLVDLDEDESVWCFQLRFTFSNAKAINLIADHGTDREVISALIAALRDATRAGIMIKRTNARDVDPRVEPIPTF